MVRLTFFLLAILQQCAASTVQPAVNNLGVVEDDASAVLQTSAAGGTECKAEFKVDCEGKELTLEVPVMQTDWNQPVMVGCQMKSLGDETHFISDKGASLAVVTNNGLLMTKGMIPLDGDEPGKPDNAKAIITTNGIIRANGNTVGIIFTNGLTLLTASGKIVETANGFQIKADGHVGVKVYGIMTANGIIRTKGIIGTNGIMETHSPVAALSVELITTYVVVEKFGGSKYHREDYFARCRLANGQALKSVSTHNGIIFTNGIITTKGIIFTNGIITTNGELIVQTCQRCTVESCQGYEDLAINQVEGTVGMATLRR